MRKSILLTSLNSDIVSWRSVARNSICAPPFCLWVQLRVVCRQDLSLLSRLQVADILFLHIPVTAAFLLVETWGRHCERFVVEAGVGGAHRKRSMPFPRGPALYILFPTQRTRATSPGRRQVEGWSQEPRAVRRAVNDGRPGHRQLLYQCY